MVNAFKHVAMIYYNDGEVEETSLDQFASLSDCSVHFVEFTTSRGRYSYVSGAEPFTNEKGLIVFRPYVHYLRYNVDKKEWEPTNEIAKVFVTRSEDHLGNVLAVYKHN